MALICDVELNSGLTINNAYLRIVRFTGTDFGLDFDLSVYVDKSSFEGGKSAVSTFTYSMDYDKNHNLFRQMYEYLLSMSEYKDAVEA